MQVTSTWLMRGTELSRGRGARSRRRRDPVRPRAFGPCRTGPGRRKAGVVTGRRSRARAPGQDRPGRTCTGRTPLLLLTTTGHSTGRPRTVALLYLQRGAAFVVCSVDVRQELASPWVRNVRTHPDAVVEIGRRTVSVRARPATTGETEEWVAAPGAAVAGVPTPPRARRGAVGLRARAAGRRAGPPQD